MCPFIFKIKEMTFILFLYFVGIQYNLPSEL